MNEPAPSSAVDRLIRYCLENRTIVALVSVALVAWGILVAPFDWEIPGLSRSPLPVDAIPDIGENQQIVFTDWPGRSPRDVEDQVTYPLTVALLGVPGVKTVRSYSMFGFSQVFLIFDERMGFADSRTRIIEKLNSLPAGLLPEGTRPALGPDATALGQVFWYTLEGRTPDGRPAGGWDLEELRSIQDWTVRYALQSADGVSEVASVGGFVREYQVDVDPDALRAFGVTLAEVADAARESNLDVGAGVLEANRVEYAVRGVGFLRGPADLEQAVVKAEGGTPVRLGQVARVAVGPAPRRGALDKDGVEAVGGVVVVRHGENPLAAIKDVQRRIAELAPSLPRRTLPDGTESRVTIVPFYDRTTLIRETLGTLNDALYGQVLVTALVILLMAGHFGSATLISAVMPLAVLGSFIGMKVAGVDANLVSLSGIAIAIGTVVDMGIVICENILQHAQRAAPGTPAREVVFRAASEVGSAVSTAIATTIVGFLPVFAMQGPEGKLFRPLAYTKTFALAASVVIALTLIPPLAETMMVRSPRAAGRARRLAYGGLVAGGLALGVAVAWWAGAIVAALGAWHLLRPRLPAAAAARLANATSWLAVALVAVLLTREWMPLGPDRGFGRNFLMMLLPVGGLMAGYTLFQHGYARVLGWCLAHRALFLALPAAATLGALAVWFGLPPLVERLPAALRTWGPVSRVAHAFPGLGREFMPPLDEGSYLLMPTAMPHAGMEEMLDVIRKQDLRIARIPEVESAVGKVGRVESALDPAPLPMIETLIRYRPAFLSDAAGRRLAFRHDPAGDDLHRDEAGRPVPAPDGEPYRVRGVFARDPQGRLVPDPQGRPFPLWRPPLDPALNPGRAAWAGMRRPDDIWAAILDAAALPGVTSAPRLQPIAARLVMLQSGLRAPMGLKVHGPTLEAVEAAGLALERELKRVPAVEPATVVADRIVGKPYLEIVPDRAALARHGVSVAEFQETLETAVGGRALTTTVEGRERYAVRLRYAREQRDSVEALRRVLVGPMGGPPVPLEQVAAVRYVRGPDMVKSEDTFLTGYVLFDKRPGWAEVDVVEQARRFLDERVSAGALRLPEGVRYAFAGSYENQVRAQQRLAVVVPLSLLLIYLLLYRQFRRHRTSVLVFTGVAVCWAGGLWMMWLYAQPWFLDAVVLGVNLRDLFQVHPVNLSVAIWVGFLALFGIATDDGVVMGTYLEQLFADRRPATVADIRAVTLEAGLRRMRPCLMTTATTVLALLPVLTATGRGADLMIPMAIPSFGGMLIEILTMLIVPTLYCGLRERELSRRAAAAVPSGG